MSDEVQVLHLDANEPHIAGSRRAVAFLGERVALVVSHPPEPSAAAAADAAGNDADADAQLRALVQVLLAERATTASLVLDLERMLAAFDASAGARPPVQRGLEGRVRVEIDFLGGAAGLAHHGVAGFAVGPAFVRESVQARARGTRQLEHVFTYECCRNYIVPETFTPLFEHCLAPGAVVERGVEGATAESCWGFFNQSFVNVLGVLLLADAEPALKINYHGSDGAAFLASMEAQLDRHVAGVAAGELCFSDTFAHERLPWAAHQSLDNAWAGVLVRLWRRHGRGELLQRFFTVAIPLLHANGRAPASRADAATARENVMLAYSVAARADLSGFFARSLGMPLREGAAELAAVLAAC